MNQGPALWTGGSGEQKGHAQEEAAENGAEQERRKGGMKGPGRREGGRGPRGSGGGRWLSSCNEVLRVRGGPWSAAAAAPLAGAGGWLLSLGDGEENEAPPGSYCPRTSIREVRA